MNRKEIIMSKLAELKEQGWTDEFELDTAKIVSQALGEPYGIESFQYIASFAMVGMDQYRAKLLLHFENDEAAMDEFLDFAKRAKENGFQMPSWGTSGT